MFDNVELNLLAMEAQAKRLGVELTGTDRREMEKIARERADLFTQFKAMLIAGNIPETFRLGREICGLPPATGGNKPLVRTKRE